MRERRAYVILAALSIVLSALTVLFVIYRVSESDHKWCTLIQAAQPAYPPIKPTNPGVDPKKDKAYHNYVIILNLGRSLGCL
jgi:hypothetical protein